MAREEPTVSVLIPTYNRAEFLGHAIHSVLGQTYRDFEIIIVDDGSSDHTRQVVDKFNDPRIRYIRHNENRGTSAACNTGMRGASGKYIAFLGDDDEWSPNLLARQVPVMQKSRQIGVVCSSYWRFNQDKTKRFLFPRATVSKTREKLHKRFLKECFVSHSGALVRKDMLLSVGGFDERLRRAQDTDLWIRLSKRCEFAYIEEPLISICPVRNAGFDRQTALHRVDSMEVFLQKHWNEFSQSRSTLARRLSQLGYAHLHVGNLKEARSYLLRSLKVWPFQGYKVWLNLLALFCGGQGYSFLRRIWSCFH